MILSEFSSLRGTFVKNSKFNQSLPIVDLFQTEHLSEPLDAMSFAVRVQKHTQIVSIYKLNRLPANGIFPYGKFNTKKILKNKTVKTKPKVTNHVWILGRENELQKLNLCKRAFERV